MTRTSQFIGLAFLCMGLIACSGLQQSSSSNSELIFIGHHDGDLDIYLANPQTQSLTKLTHNHKDDIQPVWSPNGQQIAYASSESGNYDIYVMDAAGANRIQITDNPDAEYAPIWSADGNALFYISGRQQPEQIYRYDLMTRKEHQLTQSDSGITIMALANDGNTMAYIERGDGKKRILKTMLTDGSGTTTVVDSIGPYEISWSPDNQKIAFSARKSRRTNLYLVDVSSKNIAQLTDTNSNDSAPLWLPNGQQLLFLSARDLQDRAQIYRININSKQVDRISQSGLEEMNLALSPDGQKVSFVRFEQRFFHAYEMDLSTGEIHRVAADLKRAQLTPSYRPEG